MNERRPNPDELLKRLQAEEKPRGKLKVFLGACPGVGKTYTMLESARQKKKEGVDVVVGLVETHGRAETAALLDGLAVLPRKALDYRGVNLQEFDLDASLARKPSLLLVDELAHSNAPGSLHLKRFQDVEDLLSAGIDVFTTLNIQHLESLNDVVAQITGVQVRETVPDSILELADEVEVVDLPPDELLERLREGKVYFPAQAETASRSFFQKGNLLALRELALRRAADRVEGQVQDYRRQHSIRGVWPTGEKILAAVGTNPSSAQLIRRAKRLASMLRCSWYVAYVETPTSPGLAPGQQDRILEHQQLTESLGGTFVTLTGMRAGEEILRFARMNNVGRIIVGKPVKRGFLFRKLPSIVDELIFQSDDIDIQVTQGDPDPGEAKPERSKQPAEPLFSRRYLWCFLSVTIVTCLGLMLQGRVSPTNLAMFYLLNVAAVAFWLGQGPSILASFLGVMAFDFFFVPPFLSFAVSDTEYLFTFAVMLCVGLVISTLAARIRRQVQAARERENRTSMLYTLSQALVESQGEDILLQTAADYMGEVFGARVEVFTTDEKGALHAQSLGQEAGVAQWVLDKGQKAGKGTSTLPGFKRLFLPLTASQETLGVLAVEPPNPIKIWSDEQLRLLEGFASQIAAAIERRKLAFTAEETRMETEREKMRNTFLSAVSHDLRSPLAAITGLAGSLLDNEEKLSQSQKESMELIVDESERLNRLVQNLLDITRLESGNFQLKKEWHSLEELLGSALSRLDRLLKGRDVTVNIPDFMPLMKVDGVLLEQLFFNLVENAVKHTPPETPIGISARLQGSEVEVEVADHGKGIPEGESERIFQKFYRGKDSGRESGVGLGLTICKEIVEMHGGKIRVSNRASGGAVFGFILPLPEKPPGPEEP